jgi:hypothetical protein
MTLDNLLTLTIPYSLGNNQFTIDLISINNLNGKLYYETEINKSVQKKYGIYAFCNPINNDVLYIGKGGTLKNDGTYKIQNLNGRLKAARGSFSNSFEYFKDIMNQYNFESLNFLVLYSSGNYPPAYIEAVSLHHYFNRHNNLPMFNNEF